MPQSYLVCRDDELKDGDRRVVSCDGTEVGVFRVDGELVAMGADRDDVADHLHPVDGCLGYAEDLHARARA